MNGTFEVDCSHKKIAVDYFRSDWFKEVDHLNVFRSFKTRIELDY